MKLDMKLNNHLLTSSLSQKSSLDPSTYPHVDLALKRLKMIARRLSANLVAFEEESRLLERIFYKGKNQHRSGLFWKRVQETRRLCKCLRRLDLHASITQIRHAFYNSMDYQSQTILRTSWTHLPHVSVLKSAMQNYAPSRELLLKMSQRFVDAYSCFKRAMQTGAFLQLILTLSAISCRLHFLTQALLEIHEELISTLANLWDFLITSKAGSMDISPAAIPTPEEKHVSSHLPILSTPSVVGLASLKDQGDDEPPIKPGKKTIAKEGNQPSTIIVRKELSIVSRPEIPAMDEIRPQSSRQRDTPSVGRGSKTKVKRKPVDEIDAIFGF